MNEVLSRCWTIKTRILCTCIDRLIMEWVDWLTGGIQKQLWHSRQRDKEKERASQLKCILNLAFEAKNGCS